MRWHNTFHYVILTLTMDTDLTPRVIRTSDRIQFKRCRRKWAFSSNLRGNLTYSGESPAPLWFGTGFHFALEDFHGYNRFGDPFKAFQAFAAASETADRKSGTSTVPTDLDELLELAKEMFRHYGDWQENRREFETLRSDERRVGKECRPQWP